MARVTPGQAFYNLLISHGAAMYQLLMVPAGYHSFGDLFGVPKTLCYVQLLLLILIVIFILFRRRARKRR